MRLMTVTGLELELPATHPVLVLKEVDPPSRELRFPIGFTEGIAIANARRGLSTPRPLTHELFADVLEQLEVTLEVVEITARRGNIFLAQLTLVGSSGKRVVPCRPSDAVALALRQRLPVPIMVSESLLPGTDSAWEQTAPA